MVHDHGKGSFEDEFITIIETGDEDAARRFLLKHANEFPEEIRNSIAADFFEEVLSGRLRKEESNAALLKSALSIMKEIDKARKELEKKKKLLEIKKDLE